MGKRDKGAKLLFAYDQSGRLNVPDGGIDVDSGDILPNGFYKEDKLIALSLSFNREAMGYMILEVDDDMLSITPVICWHYSSTLKRIFIQEEKDRKAGELKKALKVLKETQDKLIENEKISHLGRIVAGVAHEINTPLGLGITYLSLVEDSVKELMESYNLRESEDRLLKSILEKIDVSTSKSMESLKNTSKLIQSFKEIAVLSNSLDIRRFNLKTEIESCVELIENNFKNNLYRVYIHCPKTLTSYGDPGAVFQTIKGLMENSIYHGFTGLASDKIFISVIKEGERAVITYSDNGKGIDEENAKHIFEPFYTTKRNRGFLGLGLNTVYNSVVHQLKGSIEFIESENGARFLISIPLSRSELEPT